MKFLRPTVLLSILPAGLVAGCAVNEASYPSLALRPIERVEMTATPVAAAPEAAPPAPAASGNVAAALAAARKADGEFQAKLAASRPAIEAGRAAAPGSEPWIVAQQAYSDAESAKAGIGSALADLDQLHQEAVSVGDATRLSEIEAAIMEIQELDQAAHAMLDSLQPSGS
jgi:hypothetical protein